MKRLISRGLKCALVAGFAAMVCAPSAFAAGPVQLRFANYFAPSTEQGAVFKEFCDDLNKQGAGKVEVTYYPGGTLFDGENTVDGVKNGVADIGLMTTGHYTGRFPVSEALTAVNGYASAYVTSHVAEDFMTKFPAKEWDGYQVLLAFGNSPMVLFSTKKPIRTLEDFQGNKTRVKGRQAEQAKLLGGSPISIPAGDQYDALSKGVIDSTLPSMEAAKTWRIAEVCKYCTLTNEVFSPPCYYIIMNKGKYNSLPDDVKALLAKLGDEYTEKAAVMSNHTDMIGAEFGKSKGMEFIKLSAEETAKWQAKVVPATEAYVQDMIKKGFAEAEVRSWVSFIKERQGFWLQEQIKKGIKSPMGPKEINSL